MNRSYLTLKYDTADEPPVVESTYNVDTAPVGDMVDNQLIITYEANHSVQGLNNLRSAAIAFPYPKNLIIEDELATQVKELEDGLS